jgi:type II secretory pathway pseudopilin PulG
MVSGRREAGFNMVVLAVAITVMNIAVAAALPLWSTAMKREREEELIFRGVQYAEAIRVFQQRQGRLPVTLEELIKVEPRSIRKLWKDPMTESGEWGLIIATPQGGAATGGEAGPEGRGRLSSLVGRRLRRGTAGQPPGGNRPPGTGLPPSKGGPKLPRGPIRGVYSLSTEESLKRFFDHDHYNEWKFDLDLVLEPGGQQPAVGGRPAPGQGKGPQQASAPRFDVKWIGRPFRPGIELGNQRPSKGRDLSGRAGSQAEEQ